MRMEGMEESTAEELLSDGAVGDPLRDSREAVANYRDPSTRGGLYLPDDRYNLTVTRLTEVRRQFGR